MKSLRFYTAILFFLIIPYVVYSQLSNDIRISNVEIKYADDKIFVPYKIINGKQSDRYVVWIEFYNQQNQLMQSKTVRGDIDVVKGIGDKLVSWDVKADGVVLNEKIYAKISAKLLPDASAGKAFAYSTIFPGAGHYQYKKGKPYWLKGVLAYGLIGGSVGTYIMSADAYNKYSASNLPSAEDPNFKTALQYRQTSLILAGVGLGVWLIDYTGLISKASKHKNVKPSAIISDKNYKMYAAASQTQHINTRGLPPNLFAELYFSDENGNGVLEAREKAELKVVLSNQGGGDAQLLEIDVVGSIYDKSLVIQNANQKIPVLKPGEKKDIKIPITTDIDLKTNSHRFTINVKEHYGYDMDPAQLLLNTYAYQPPLMVVSGYEIIDAGKGTMSIVSDGRLQAGEQVKVKLMVQNIGQGEAKNAEYKIFSKDANIFIEQGEGIFKGIAPGEVKEIYFVLSPNKRVVSKENLPVFLTITNEIERGSLKDEQLPIALDQTPPKANIVEVKSDLESLKKDIARFEYTSSKFKANIANVENIAAVAPSKTKRPNSVGVVMGIANYKELPPAPYADNDARIIKDYFEKVLGVEQVIIYTNDEVSGFFFDDVFNPDIGELRKAVVKDETEVFIFYSGHGIPDKDGKNVYLFPSDGKVTRLENQGYNVEKMYEDLTKLGAKHVTVILDACFSGASRSSTTVAAENLIGQKGVKVRAKNSWVGDPKFTVITSSTGEETSLGFDETKTGLFTYYLAAGLQGKADENGDNSITLGELKQYVINNVKETSTKILGIQTPMFYGDDSKVIATY